MDLKQPPISLSGATDRRSSGRSFVSIALMARMMMITIMMMMMMMTTIMRITMMKMMITMIMIMITITMRMMMTSDLPDYKYIVNTD